MVTVAPASANVPPTTSITSPANGASFARRTAITTTAAASDSDGTIQEVELFRGDGATKLGQDTTAPYSHRWTPTSPGTKQLRVKATDNLGAVATSARVTITIR